MKVEVNSAANFLVHLLRLGRCQATEPQLDKFRLALLEVLRRRYRDHWFPERPFKGSGYRCLRINGKLDPVLRQAAEATTLTHNLLHAAFPSELTMWIDPLEVSYRIGENGSICVLYDAKTGLGGNGNANINEPWKPSNQGGIQGRTSPPSSPASTAAVHRRTSNHRSGDCDGALSDSSSSGSGSGSGVDNNASASASSVCKSSMRRMDYLLDPRQSAPSMEHLAAYVSS